MPYIEGLRRQDLDPETLFHARTPGELTYQLTELVLQYLNSNSSAEFGPKFHHYAEALGALEATKLELYRRSIAPYEDGAIERNGDLEYPGRG